MESMRQSDNVENDTIYKSRRGRDTPAGYIVKNVKFQVHL
jgi:hypothetical protein